MDHSSKGSNKTRGEVRDRSWDRNRRPSAIDGAAGVIALRWLGRGGHALTRDVRRRRLRQGNERVAGSWPLPHAAQVAFPERPHPAPSHTQRTPLDLLTTAWRKRRCIEGSSLESHLPAARKTPRHNCRSCGPARPGGARSACERRQWLVLAPRDFVSGCPRIPLAQSGLALAGHLPLTPSPSGRWGPNGQVRRGPAVVSPHVPALREMVSSERLDNERL